MFALISCSTSAQYTNENSFMRKALILFSEDANGFYQSKENVLVESVHNVVSVYAYNKKSHNLYLRTTNGNFVVTLNNDYAKIVKNNNEIPKLSEEEIEKLVISVNEDLNNCFGKKNDSLKIVLQRKREQEIADSIAKAEALKKEADAKRQKELAIENGYEEYRQKFASRIIPNNGTTLKCTQCNKTISPKFILCSSIQYDSIYFFTEVTKELGDSYAQLHVAAIPKVLKTDPNFMYHVQAFRDSLSNDTLDYTTGLIELYNEKELYEHYNRINKKAPYGYIENYRWNKEFYVTFYFRYMNLNPKTIKYIDIYWKITNDVGDVRKTGNFKGTGPLAQYESASWNWDSSSYYVAGDASRMSLTKVILTYMNGTQKILGANQIQVNWTSEYSDDMKDDSYTSNYVSSYGVNENDKVDSPASYEKGAIELYNDIQRNLVYDRNNGKGSRLYCILKLEIKPDGTIGDIKVDETFDSKYNDAAINAAKKLGRFVPASHEGKNVSVWFKLPVPFIFE